MGKIKNTFERKLLIFQKTLTINNVNRSQFPHSVIEFLPSFVHSNTVRLRSMHQKMTRLHRP